MSALLLAGALTGVSGGERLADPTRPALSVARRSAPPEVAHDGLTLQSVLLSSQRRVAVIDGRRVGIGDRIRGARVADISLSGVRLRGPKGETWLTLSGNGFKKPSSARRSPR